MINEKDDEGDRGGSPYLARSTIAMSTHGCIKHRDDREVFTSYVEAMVPILHPQAIVVHGSAPDDVFRSAIEDGARIIAFQSEFAKSRRSKKDI